MMANGKLIKRKKTFITISLIVLILTSFRIGWIIYHKTPHSPLAKNGVVDLTAWDFVNEETIILNGEWKFYPNMFINPTSGEVIEEGHLIPVPGGWSDLFEGNNTFNYGSYRLKIILPSFN